MDALAFSRGFISFALIVLGVTLIYLLSAMIRYLKRFTTTQSGALARQIDQLLPQTQCRQCGFNGCMPYAEAMANGEAINRCPPGGAHTIAALAELINVPTMPLDSNLHAYRGPSVAVIRESECIGCTKCIQACPVDAILGAPKLMHTVIAEECTGCDLCLDPCPVDCIDMLPIDNATARSSTIRHDSIANVPLNLVQVEH